MLPQTAAGSALVAGSEPQPPLASAGDLPTLADRLASASSVVTASCLWVLLCTRLYVPSGGGLCFPPSCVSSIIKSSRPSKSDSLGIPSPVPAPPGCEPSRRAQNFQYGGRTSVVQLFPSLRVAYLAVLGFGFYPHCAPPAVSLWLLLCLWVPGIFFFGGFQCLPVDGCSSVSCDFSTLTRRGMSLYSAILDRSPHLLLLFFKIFPAISWLLSC